ncbi:MAG: hypothetical protein AB1925_30355 [Actinomycetota bacterium]
MTETWPGAFDTLLGEMRAGRGRPALVDWASPHAAHTLDRLEERVARVVSLGRRVGQMERAPLASELTGGLGAGPTLLVDIEILFTPQLGIEVVPHLRHLAQRAPLIVAWPGRITVSRLSYSLPGRADHVDEPARDLVVLRPVNTQFPDEVPYELERFPA